MRRLFIGSCTLVALLLVLLTLSLWQVTWQSADGADQVSLTQGCLRIWIGSPGDFAGFPKQLSIGAWSGDALMWKPEFEWRGKMWVIARPTGAAYPVARPILGTCAVLPLIISLACSGAAATGFGLVFRHRRELARTGRRCASCGYDIRGIGPRCPECGTQTGILRALMQRVVLQVGRHRFSATPHSGHTAPAARPVRS
jgi:hypothetical protein